ncbi:hypothetical protein B0A52_06665 [Exophiala mesophila]|uniref:Tse2 ADP-ribosyltransferase toxin domain-containing protein n=1 Tax=Exophiala mesophila TaxID=212818 RepID=A0A438N1J9_EXOME|nr:hypothetical protein B0A52_06665 [Exophiala mesophila]
MSPYSFSKGLKTPAAFSFLQQRESPKMFITRLLSFRPRRGHPRNLKRNIASISILKRVPATIYRLQQGPRSNLVAPHPEGEGIPIDEVQLDRNGLVKTGLSLKEPLFNGAIFMPNTHLMQELTRDAFDAYFEQDESCKPILVRLAKGTMVPESLQLLQQDSQFALQPIPPRRLAELNEYLDEFYCAYATIIDAGDWYQKNAFADATPDEEPHIWTEL